MGLDLVLRQVKTLNESSDFTSEVIIVDNDPAASARTTAGRFSAELVSYVVEPTPGIAAGRNRALDEAADADLLVFIDDDERPQEQWLLPLVETWKATGAAAVMGRVVSEFEYQLDSWISAGRFFIRKTMKTGTPMEVAATGNLLLDIAKVRGSGVRFDGTFGLTGAEDTLFSRRLREAGHSIVWCDESVVTDAVPRLRATRRWVLTRAWSHGNSLALVELHMAKDLWRGLIVRLRFIAGGALRIVAGGLRSVLGVAVRSQRHQARGLRTSFRGVGMVAGALGLAYLEYGRSESWRDRLVRYESL